VSDLVHKLAPDRLHYEPVIYSHTNTETDVQHHELTLNTYKDSNTNILQCEPTFCIHWDSTVDMLHRHTSELYIYIYTHTHTHTVGSCFVMVRFVTIHF